MIHQQLKQFGKKHAAQSARRICFVGLTCSLATACVYLITVGLIRPLPFHPTFALVVPAAILMVAAFMGWRVIRRFSRPQSVARELEAQNPDLALKVRSALDFIDHKADVDTPALQTWYVERIQAQLRHAHMAAKPWRGWALGSLASALCLAGLWSFLSPVLMAKLDHRNVTFGTLELQLQGGTISLFEPAYTGIPGRTIALQPGTYEAFPGSRVRFSIPENPALPDLYYQTQRMDEPVALGKTGQGNFSCEILLVEPVALRFLVSDKGQSAPFVFSTKTDHPPQIQLKGHTAEGPVSTYDPLYIDAVVRDDFSISTLHVVAEWEGESRRISLPIPNHQRNHFLSRNRWSLSELVDPTTARFSLYLEAQDNNPIGAGGIGRSQRLEFELENPEQIHRDFVDMARQLLDQMTHAMGDNLDTHLQSPHETYYLQKAQVLSKQIQTGLMRAQQITNTLLDLLDEDPYGTALDRDFLRSFRKDLVAAYQFRMHMGQMFASVRVPKQSARSFSTLRNLHGQEEVRLESLTYDLLLQLKMWAMLDMERKKSQIDETLDTLNDLLDRASEMDDGDLEREVSRLLEELMKQFHELLAKGAQEMDRSVEEFMNTEGLENQNDMMDQLKEQLLDALKRGDMGQVKQLLEQLEQMMMSTVSQMQQAMGELSPEMQAMMQQMREMMGLLRELKAQEEELESDTQAFKQQIDQEMGGNSIDMSSGQRAEQIKIMDHIKELLQTLHENLVHFQQEDTYRDLIDTISQLKEELNDPKTEDPEKAPLRQQIANLERTLDFVVNRSLDYLQELTLRSLETTDEMQGLLDQGEYKHALELGLKLESLLMQGEMMSERGVAEQVQEKAKPKETFETARQELFQILEALQQMRQNVERRRQDYLRQSGSEDQHKLAQRQEEIRQMIDEFECSAREALDGSQLLEKLDDVSLSMDNAKKKLDTSKLDGATFYEQEALRKIGEMMEQMQQTLQPGPSAPQFRFAMGPRQEGMTGDPTGDVFIPQSEFQMTEDQLKDAIRRQLQRNPPDAFGREIRKYYDTLMDQ